MARVLKIENRIVTIGNEDGSLEEYDIGYFNYSPRVNDEVKIYQGNGTTVIALADRVEKQKGHLVNKTTYVLFAVLLGWVGINEFYAGYTGRGIVSCIFVWTGIPEIVNFIKGMMALAKPADGNGNIRV